MLSEPDGNGELQVAMVSHDLRGPINAIVLGAEMLRRRRLGTAEDIIVQRIHRVAKRMASLVDRVLDQATLQLGASVVLERGPVDLEEVCRETLEEFRMSHPGRELRLAAEEGIRGSWDRIRLAELVSNLVGNALDHGDPSGPVLVHARRRERAAQIEVVNQGPTIPRELWRAIFEPFRRAEGIARGSGVGLGLYIVAQIAAAHGGRVEVSSLQRTTRFTVTVPIGTA
jgi:signal transduction histidine kinase